MKATEIAETIDTIISQLNKSDYPNAPINWGDLRCVSIEIAQTIYPEKSDKIYKITIDDIASLFYLKTEMCIEVISEW